ncbi:MAG: tetratricopeptide repeat protein [Candidatus Delongbacteria bacterium]|nr:tetratricopeptide repeat protein [Candidatus Delongbacteria bacterium]
MKRTIIVLAVAITMLIFINCGPATGVKEDQIVETKKIEKVEAPKENKALTDADKMDIAKYSSYAQTKKKQKKYREMISYINQIFDLDPNFQYAKDILLFWRGGGYEELGIADSALADYENFLLIRPDYEAALVKLDYIYATTDELDKAIEVTLKLSELKPDDNDLNKKLGKYYFQKVQKLKEENEEDPEIPELAETAIEYFEKYVEINPDDEEINTLSTQLTAVFMDKDVLIEKYMSNLEKNPEDYSTMTKLGEIYYKDGLNDKANELFEKVLQNNPNDLKIIKRLIRINKNNVSKAITYNLKAIELEPDNENYNLSLAKLYKEKNQFTKARSECKKSISKNPNNKNAYKIWAQIYTAAVVACETEIQYEDKLVFIIAYGLFEQSGDTRRLHSMKEGGQVPSKMDYFQNKSITAPTRDCYKWINMEWEEAKYIEKYIKGL